MSSKAPFQIGADVHENVKELRRALGSVTRSLSPAQLARLLNERDPSRSRALSTIQRWESGVQPDLTSIRLMAEMAGVTFEEFAQGRATPQENPMPKAVDGAAPTSTVHAVIGARLARMATEFVEEAKATGADENFMRYARARLHDPHLFEMYAGGHQTRPLTAQEQIDDYAEVIEDLRRILKKQLKRLDEQSGKLAPD